MRRLMYFMTVNYLIKSRDKSRQNIKLSSDISQLSDYCKDMAKNLDNVLTYVDLVVVCSTCSSLRSAGESLTTGTFNYRKVTYRPILSSAECWWSWWTVHRWVSRISTTWSTWTRRLVAMITTRTMHRLVLDQWNVVLFSCCIDAFSGI